MSLTPAKKAPNAVRIKLKHNLRSGIVEFIIQAIRTVVRIEHRRKVRNLIVLYYQTYKGILTSFTEKSPNNTVTKLVRPIRSPKLFFSYTSSKVDTFIPIL